jgi:urease accessory protein UreF
MTGQTYIVPDVAAPLLGDPHPLLEQIGLGESAVSPVPALRARQLSGVNSLPALRSFLGCYREELLWPVELPAIVSAHSHALRNELRELLVLDRQMAREPGIQEFASASCRVGQRQLNRLRPLRDQRLIQRYRAAIERGDAHGWHTLVFGVWLGVFALPLRQGLAAYTWRAMEGFIERAAGPLALTLGQCAELQTEVCQPVPAKVEEILAAAGATSLRVV